MGKEGSSQIWPGSSFRHALGALDWLHWRGSCLPRASPGRLSPEPGAGKCQAEGPLRRRWDLKTMQAGVVTCLFFPSLKSIDNYSQKNDSLDNPQRPPSPLPPGLAPELQKGQESGRRGRGKTWTFKPGTSLLPSVPRCQSLGRRSEARRGHLRLKLSTRGSGRRLVVTARLLSVRRSVKTPMG